MAQGAGTFTAADVALLDEIAETILPETTTPGAKAAKTGAFMALMVTDAYAERDQRGLPRRACGSSTRRAATATGVRVHAGDAGAAAARAARRSIASRRRPWTRASQRRAIAIRRRKPCRRPTSRPHYFRMMKELALLGYFTSEIGMTQAMRYIESPGRFDPCAPHKPGDRAWASHA